MSEWTEGTGNVVDNCYNCSLACTRVWCWAKRLPDNNCSRLIQRSLRASKDEWTQVIFELDFTVVKVRSNWGKVHQREPPYIQESVANSNCYDFPLLLLPRYIPFHSDHVPLLSFTRLSLFSLSSFLFLDMTCYDLSSPQGNASPLFLQFLWLHFTMRLCLPFASLLYDLFYLLLD